MKLLFVVWLTRCGPICLGVSGMDYSRADGKCADWQEADKAIDAAIQKYTAEYKPKWAEGYWLHTRKEESWYSEAHGYRIAGFTDCTWKTVAAGGAAPTKGALAHELLHVLNSCEYIASESNPYHVGWVDRGYQKVIDCIHAGDCDK